ncbi:MAG: hypothetical protein ACK40L_10230 [Hydrogenophaga sp.]
MPEPTVTSGAAGAALVAIASAFVGQELGPLLTIAAAAFIGALVSLGEVVTPSRWDAVLYIVRYVLMALVITGTLSLLIERYTGLPAIEMLALVAFVIGWVGNRWGSLRAASLSVVETFFGRKGADK